MIQLLANRYKKDIAYTLSLIFFMGMIIPAYGMIRTSTMTTGRFFYSKNNSRSFNDPKNTFNSNRIERNKDRFVPVTIPPIENKNPIKAKPVLSADPVFIDGPSQPEMTSFKPAGTNDMVNLFTGDFSYNIPLLDVGGYPVNIFYSGGISMEQEASWVGLGWNINPGNVNRNMRGVPDDFNGEETLIQEQNMKKNITWGFSIGADLEIIGIKQLNLSIGKPSIGYSLNNYLGPALDLGVKGGTSFKIARLTASEKSTLGASIGFDANLNSRSGMTLTPRLSMAANFACKDYHLTTGIGLSTSYNSRSGMKALQLAEQMSLNSIINKKGIYERSLVGENLFSTSISFAKPSYIPAIRPSITNSSGAGRFQLGGAMLGVFGSVEIEGYGQVSEIQAADRTLKKPMVGYLYAQNAKSNPNAVMDFTRFNDQEVTPTTSIISVPQYAYDVFSIQGEGTGGTIRAYRNDNGYVRDNFTNSKDKSWSAGVDIGIPGHVGTNFNTVKTPSTIGEWNNGNTLRNAIGFSAAANGWENVYFRNPGENSVLQPNQFDDIGGTDLVRYKLGGTNFSPTIETKLQRLNSSGSVLEDVTVQNLAGISARKKRTQVISFLTALEAGNIGLDTKIKVYDSDPQNFLTIDKKLVFAEIDRVSDYRKAHHISQINITEADGKRYIYGIPVYNQIQKDFSFTVGNNCTDCTDDLVSFDPNETSVSASSHLGSGVGGKDGFVQTTETPPYAHSFLLSGLLSPDYVDVKGDGITEDDLGTSVKFNYTKLADHNWRTPMMNDKANSNPGNLSETRDDKALISYGVRESWYLQSIESKTMIAFFTLETRADGKGIGDGGAFGDINYNDISIKRLKQIDLYNKADLKKNGLTGAKPIKTVYFGYNYSLCPGTPDNQSGGKLTLERIWFTYNGQNRTNKNQYVFSYTKGTTATTGENPSYLINESDRWGNYKPHNDNPQGVKNRDYSYSLQDKTKADLYANPWSLKKILLPSGGQMEIEYESDDYAFVQNKRTAVMSGIIGFSSTNANPTANLYLVNATSITENNYIFISVSEVCTSKNEVYQKYLQGMDQLLVKLLVNMPNGPEYLTSYAMIDDYDVYNGPGSPAIWIRMKPVVDKGIAYSPLSITALEYLRERLPAQAFKAYDVSEGTALNQLENMFKGLIEGIKTTFSRIPQYLREKHKAQTVELNRSFARLNDQDGYKYGGGYRVKKIMLKDNWDRMTNQFGSTYGQEYDYTIKEIFNGTERTASSGVASYEPSIGGEENPFQSILQISNEVPLGPTSYGAIEMPVMDAFFPAPLVGYSKVTVTSIGKKQNPDPANKKTRSGVGRQVTEFYTAKDFPVYYNHTPLDPASDKQKHINPTLTFFYKYAFDSRAISQGFLVATNDMHGKLRSQSSYAENDPSTRINYTENFYRNTGLKGLDEKFDFVNNALGGEVQQGNMGIDIELMTDTREFSLKSKSFEIQAQVDWMLPPPFPLWLPFVWPVVSESENVYRAITTTKVISYHAVLERVVVIDKGSQVSTENLVYDAETGQVVVNRTNNEFDKPVYSVNYPAYWAYSGMGLAYKNIDALYSGINFLDGKIVSGISSVDQKNIFESGDELYIINAGLQAGCDPIMNSPGNNGLIWVLNKNKNGGSLTDMNPDFIFIDAAGKPYSRSGVTFRIVRSGKRNVLSASVAGATVMIDPVVNAGGGIRKLNVTNSSKVVNASAVEYKEKWQTDNDVFNYYRLEYPNTGGNLIVNGDFSQGNTGFTTQYTYHPTSYSGTHPYYSVATTSNGWFPSAGNCQDHTSGNGNMMIVDGATDFERTVWSQTVPVTANTSYLLTAWATDICQNFDISAPQLRFKINGNQVGTIFGLGTVYTCTWFKFFSSWNSGNSTSALIEISSTDLRPGGNDFALDDISFVVEQCAVAQIEVPDCSGYLEKSINPYRKGLFGYFRGHRNMVFYGDRAESIPVGQTNLSQFGFLTGFTPYWNFDNDKNLVPDQNNLKWVWNIQSTRFNSKGMELETKDALEIYTAAQYGYQKTLPTAITNNSRYDEMMYDGFEDYDYAETLNGAAINPCTKKHIDFTNMDNSLIRNTDNLGFGAHSGKHVLQISGGGVGIKTIPLNNSVIDPFLLDYQSHTIGELNELGGNFSIISESGTTYSSSSLFSNFSSQVSTSFSTPNSGGSNFVSYAYKTWQYFEIEDAGTHSFFVSSSRLSDFSNIGPGTINWNITSVTTGDAIPYSVVWSLSGSTFYQYRAQICLPKGVYKLECTYSGAQYNSCSFCTNIGTSDTYEIYIENNVNNITTYKSLSSQNSCTYTSPSPASVAMMNPVFSIPLNKKMLFSAWVRESNAQQTTYLNNEVQIDFGSGNANNVSIKPTGPVIEGWQRYEGYFTAPSGVTEMSLRLVNNTGGMIYFDDIRIHPFNANMKSYVYDPVNLRLRAELDANNYASFYEYDEEGTLIRTKAETREGIKTIAESRSAKQKNITGFQ